MTPLGVLLDRTPKRARPRRHAGIFAGSALFHVLLFVVGFSRTSGDLVTAGDAGGGPMGPVFAVSLVRAPSLEAAEAAEAAELAPLLLKLKTIQAAEGVPVPATEASGRATNLADRLRPASPQRPTGQRSDRDELQRVYGAPSPADRPLSSVRNENAHTDAQTDGQTLGSASSGALWGAIEPCWRRMSVSAQVPVTIEVTLDGRGLVKGTPRVLRSEIALLNEPRLKSEANALAALATCLPKRNAAFAGKTQRLEFPALPNRADR